MKLDKLIKHADSFAEFQSIVAPESLNPSAIPLKIKITFWGGHKIISHYYKGSTSMERITGEMLLFIRTFEENKTIPIHRPVGEIITAKIESLYDEVEKAAQQKNCFTKKIHWFRNSPGYVIFKSLFFGRSARTLWYNGDFGTF